VTNRSSPTICTFDPIAAAKEWIPRARRECDILIALTHKAWAYDLEEGLGVACDTVAQIEQFASLDAKPEAIQTVNAGKTVCAKVNIRYIEGRKLSRIRMS
jgi:2',3'-cyclic-nucleotide 2'-phosphodiesterase (5'-nucleotidase family)